MASSSRTSDIEFFARYAHNHIDRWQQIIGRRVGHEDLGAGIVTAVSANDTTIVMDIDFFGSVRRFDIRLFNDKNFYELQLPLEWRRIETRAAIEKQVRDEEYQRIAAHRIAENEEQRKRKADETRELQQMIQEAPERANFGRLRIKYRVQQQKDQSPANPLYGILKQIDTEGLLSTEQIDWLEQ